MSAVFSGYPSGYKGDYLPTKWLGLFSSFLTHSFFSFFLLLQLFFSRDWMEKSSTSGETHFLWYFVFHVTAAYIIQTVTMDNNKSPSFWLLGLGQTSNCSWDEPNSNLGRPKLSKDRLLGQTSKLGRIEPINWIRLKKIFILIFSRTGLNIHHTTFN